MQKPAVSHPCEHRPEPPLSEQSQVSRSHINPSVVGELQEPTTISSSAISMKIQSSADEGVIGRFAISR